MQRRFAAIAVCALILGFGTLLPAEAKSACGSFSVTAQGTTRSGGQCVPLPASFNGHQGATDCQGVPPAGFQMCVGYSTDTWLP
jgi:hypothetical protein